jgi:hypothetical protein
MRNINIHQFINDKQYATEGTMNAFYNFVHEIIREHATHRQDSYYLRADQLPLADQIIFLSHILDASDYQDALENPIRTQEYIKEHLSLMQQIIDTEIDQVYHDDMKEMGLCLNYHRDNGEMYYYRRS